MIKHTFVCDSCGTKFRCERECDTSGYADCWNCNVCGWFKIKITGRVVTESADIACDDAERHLCPLCAALVVGLV